MYIILFQLICISSDKNVFMVLVSYNNTAMNSYQYHLIINVHISSFTHPRVIQIFILFSYFKEDFQPRIGPHWLSLHSPKHWHISQNNYFCFPQKYMISNPNPAERIIWKSVFPEQTLWRVMNVYCPLDPSEITLRDSHRLQYEISREVNKGARH